MLYSVIAVNSVQFEVMLIAVGEFPDANSALQKGRDNMKQERPINHDQFVFNSFSLEGDPHKTREEMRIWFLQFGMKLANAEKWVQSCGRAIAKVLGIPTREELNDRQKQIDGGVGVAPSGE